MKIQILLVAVALLAVFASAQRFSEEFYCPDGPFIIDGEPQCGDSHPNGSYSLQHRCEVNCPPNTEPTARFVRCRNSSLNNLEPGTVWLPENTACVANPDQRCLVPPDPPRSFGEEGSVVCDPVDGRVGGGWDFGDTCAYHCPEGWTTHGIDLSFCEDNADNTFQPKAPCCEPPCTLEEPSDVLFIVQQSPCYEGSWSEITNYLVGILSEFKSSQIHAGFGFYGLNGVIETIEFSEIDDDFKQQVLDVPYDFKNAGSHGVTIIEDAVENAFRPEFGDRPDIPNHVIFVMNTISSDREIIEEVDNLVEASDALKAKVEEVFAVGIGSGSSGSFFEELFIRASRADHIHQESDLDFAIPNIPARVVCRRCPEMLIFP